MVEKNQSDRLTKQHKNSQGVISIFGNEAKKHDSLVRIVSRVIIEKLGEIYPQLTFHYRMSITKAEINIALQKVDKELGQTLFVSDAGIKPDGGIIEVKDNLNNWRVILVSEAKHQGKDIENIRKGQFVGKNNDQDLMVAGNAIERSHKNISEMQNYMLNEKHFPYVLFLEGSNFLTQNVLIERPDNRVVTLRCDSGSLNRLDRLTSANRGMPINTNLCINKFIQSQNGVIMLQTASIYTKGNGENWNEEEMFSIMFEIANTSIKCLSEQGQLVNNKQSLIINAKN